MTGGGEGACAAAGVFAAPEPPAADGACAVEATGLAAGGAGAGGTKYAWYRYSTRNERTIAIKTLRSI